MVNDMTTTTSPTTEYTMTITMKRKTDGSFAVPLTDIEELIIRLITNGCHMDLIDMTTEIK